MYMYTKAIVFIVLTCEKDATNFKGFFFNFQVLTRPQKPLTGHSQTTFVFSYTLPYIITLKSDFRRTAFNPPYSGRPE